MARNTAQHCQSRNGESETVTATSTHVSDHVLAKPDNSKLVNADPDPTHVNSIGAMPVGAETGGAKSAGTKSVRSKSMGAGPVVIDQRAELLKALSKALPTATSSNLMAKTSSETILGRSRENTITETRMRPHERENALSLAGVYKEFGGFSAVKGLNFDVRKGEIFGFLGPNGAGKTTTLRMILEIVPLTKGTISVLGSTSAIAVRHRIGYLPEERGLYRKMRAAESIAYFAQLRGVTRKEARKRADALLEQFGLGEFARSKNEALSKGMAQKVQLLATIAHDPELLILDEPFSGLDPINQKTLEDLIAAMQAAGKTIIFSTHVMEHAERLCDRFLILAKGEKRFEGDLTQARALMPSRLTIQTSASPEKLSQMQGVNAITRLSGDTHADDNDAMFRIDLSSDGNAHSFLKAAFAADVAIKKFDAANASLHDIFVALVKDADGQSDPKPAIPPIQKSNNQ
ncbi:MAG: ATP-binding cassette domain-containing protein [Pseudomonadota bacterium]